MKYYFDKKKISITKLRILSYSLNEIFLLKKVSIIKLNILSYYFNEISIMKKSV